MREGRTRKDGDRRRRDKPRARPRAAACRCAPRCPSSKGRAACSPAGACSSTARMCWAGVTISQASHASSSARSRSRANRRLSGMPGRKTLFSWRALTASTTSGSSAQSSVSRPPVAATCASAVPQAPPPITPSLMPSHLRRGPSPRFRRAASAPAPARRGRRIRPRRKALGARPGDHRRIVGAQPSRRNAETAALILRRVRPVRRESPDWPRLRQQRPVRVHRSFAAQARCGRRGSRRPPAGSLRQYPPACVRRMRLRAEQRSSARRRRNAVRPNRPAGEGAAQRADRRSCASASIAGPPG